MNIPVCGVWIPKMVWYGVLEKGEKAPRVSPVAIPASSGVWFSGAHLTHIYT